MTNYTYLGWGTTDSNGVAKLDHDANDDPINHSYTGSGVGEVDVVASLDNPIVSGSVVSAPYEVTDCLLYEQASATYGDSGTSGNRVVNRWKVNYVEYCYTAPFCFEFDVVSVTNPSGLRLRIMEEDTTPIYQLNNLSILQAGDHVKCVTTPTGSEWFVNGVSKYTNTGTAENPFSIVLIVLNTYSASITLENVMAYPM